MDWAVTLLGALAVFLAALFGTGLALRLLRRHAILDHPTERSSHAVPTPKGGGVPVVGALLVAWAAGGAVLGVALPRLPLLLALAVALAALSWWNDLRPIPPLLRLVVHVAAATAGLLALPGAGAVFQGLLPPFLDLAATVLLWVWFLNLFNFMDGIDGIAGAETASVGFGLAGLALASAWADGMAFFGLTAGAAALGFLRWNWEPAKIFLGDVGSVPLGFLLGWLLLAAAAAGHWQAALILPLYYLADASITLLRRLFRGERVWIAHRSHFYQRAVEAGLSHGEVVRMILFANLALVPLALVADRGGGIASLAAAAATIAFLLYSLGRKRPGRAEADGGPQGSA